MLVVSGTRRDVRGAIFAERACPASAGTPGQCRQPKVEYGMSEC
jgi:hypothetical protein